MTGAEDKLPLEKDKLYPMKGAFLDTPNGSRYIDEEELLKIIKESSGESGDGQ